ncbi:hypothetical protein THASP1DRAFT_23236 [Thamnocephalis sphaerospora]|uniref:Uncharacterized protein n=1 Tax=Thamnocephalis sphaerospora TaxID=78915 RepID=A0A4P9XRX9_9FUNG|nr:hypothetical protein THASP1DRAFT_23236 [Thamnocephalis sphaerospora]|eukprot:RKP08855.1 hypothetical protein THASP1DRAFT_23236 [Thamnocephalis sphaerospora]
MTRVWPRMAIKRAKTVQRRGKAVTYLWKHLGNVDGYHWDMLRYIQKRRWVYGSGAGVVDVTAQGAYQQGSSGEGERKAGRSGRREQATRRVRARPCPLETAGARTVHPVSLLHGSHRPIKRPFSDQRHDATGLAHRPAHTHPVIDSQGQVTGRGGAAAGVGQTADNWKDPGQNGFARGSFGCGDAGDGLSSSLVCAGVPSSVPGVAFFDGPASICKYA